ncbi:hypothetical protein NDU88_004068 [Pleurodeles waltl]|uniref:Uncharacterized protein n=1 Tax=Pleurodeles waltl TaxID=8319 RepID=A0AAV7PFM5_PLEWA|nr:hypothetical protein NDU88_004068 [Pleurodeles waltl]
MRLELSRWPLGRLPLKGGAVNGSGGAGIVIWSGDPVDWGGCAASAGGGGPPRRPGSPPRPCSAAPDVGGRGR